ncbi:CaiB/BaiF CoA transferase family protein [Pacificispira sp.]|uniref:CaiB/BaiF CoA transferase family protein n=1 Tax=Pacificispira sp. TaxID=2888761 RepID=UPI003B52C49B
MTQMPETRAEVQLSGALSGVRVLDCSRLLPGAYCTQIMGDMGAEVIKIEEPRRGDYHRSFPPIAKEESGSFLLLNRNKKSVTLNLKSARGRDLFLDLAKDADVVLEGFRPGVMDRLGVGYEALQQVNPRLIYCAISGFGQDGPYRLKPGHDLNYMALAGCLQLFGQAGGDPMVPGLSIADVGGGSLTALAGILAALLSRGQTGKGQFVDISMTDGAMSWLSFHGGDWLFDGVEPRGGERPFIGQAPCYNVYRCADDRHVALGIIEPQFWQSFCDRMGLEDLKNDQWPEGDDARRQKERLQALFETRPRDEWVAFLESADIPFSAVNSIEEAVADPQLRARGMVQTVNHPVEGDIPQFGFPIKLSGTPCRIETPPPRLGEHNHEVLSRLGLSQGEIEALEEEDNW